MARKQSNKTEESKRLMKPYVEKHTRSVFKYPYSCIITQKTLASFNNQEQRKINVILCNWMTTLEATSEKQTTKCSGEEKPYILANN